MKCIFIRLVLLIVAVLFARERRSEQRGAVVLGTKVLSKLRKEIFVGQEGVKRYSCYKRVWECYNCHVFLSLKAYEGGQKCKRWYWYSKSSNVNKKWLPRKVVVKRNHHGRNS